jgi:hypothetical protein
MTDHENPQDTGGQAMDPTGVATPTAPQRAVTYPIVARAGQYYRNVRYLLALGAIAAGGWFAYDGWVNWPRMNAEYDRLEQQHRAGGTGDEKSFKAIVDEQGLKKHNDLEILIQKVLAVTLPVAGLALLVAMLYKSRGEYRFDGKTLHVPGHPPIDIEAISAIDRAKWDRKGIAYVDYATPGGGIGRAKLDDFLYDREPTDQIFDELWKRAGGATE